VLLKGDDKRQAAQADGVRRGVGRKGDEALSLVWRGGRWEAIPKPSFKEPELIVAPIQIKI
jgi:hypothetical protein